MPSAAPVLAEKFSKADAAFLISRIVSVCGEKRGANIEILASEWHDALQFFDKQRVERAWRTYRDRPPCYWPKPADILAVIREDMPQPGRTEGYRAERYDFARDGRSQNEEIAHRIQVIAEAKRKFPFTPAFDFNPDEAGPKPAQADDGAVSDELKEIARKRGYWRGEA